VPIEYLVNGRRYAIALTGLLLVGTSTVIAATVIHFHYPKTYTVTLTLDPGCSSKGIVHVAGHDWFGPRTSAYWPETVRGMFTVTSPHRATFSADVGGQETFTLLPPGSFVDLSCPLPSSAP
jgi:hypothetical protein